MVDDQYYCNILTYSIINWDVDRSMVYQQGSKHDGTMTSIGCDGGQCNQQPRNISQQKSHVEHTSRQSERISHLAVF